MICGVLDTGGSYGGGSATEGSANTAGHAGGAGAVRIIWGAGRTYPSNSADV